MNKFQDLSIKLAEDRSLDQPAFGAIVRGAVLAVPPALFPVLEQYQLDTASEFAVYARMCPEAFVEDLDLSRDEVVRKTGELLGILRGHVSEKLLDKTPLPDVQYDLRVEE